MLDNALFHNSPFSAFARGALGVAALALCCSATLEAQHGLGGGEKKWIAIEWDTTETKNYAIEFEKTIAGESVDKIGKELEDALEQYVLVFKVKRGKEKLKVRFLDTLNTFEQVGGDPSHPGFFRPSDKYLVLLNTPFYQLIPTTYHEAFHQYLDVFMDGSAIPTWFNEGMASFFEQMERTKGNKQLSLELINNRSLRMIKDAVGTRTAIPLAELVDARYEQFHAKERETLFYTQSFAVIYYFMKVAKPASVMQYMATLKKTGDVEKANEKLFGKERKNLERVETMWKKYMLDFEISDK